MDSALPRRTRRAQRAARLACGLAVLFGLSGVAFAQQHYWYDGDARRPLWIASDVVADFSASRAEKSRVLRPALLAKGGDPTVIAAAPAGTAATSPVFRDGRSEKDRPRALPGGVILTLKPGTPEAQRAALFARHGLAQARALGGAGNVWLAETPAGLAALELANRLYESGDFAAAAPNWWQPRALK
jgi:hypothetical protein